MSDRLRDAKYGSNKAPKHHINELIDNIQADCLTVAMDKSAYWKPTTYNPIGEFMSPEEEREWIRLEQQQDSKHNQTAFKGKI